MLTQIEACLNSRKLWAITDDAGDTQPLTPAHFLIGRPILQPPFSDVTCNTTENRLTLWGQTQRVIGNFWKDWKSEYLSSLQIRNKWNTPMRNIEINDIVLLIEEYIPPTIWKTARVIAVHPGEDELVRSVTVN